MVEKKWTREPVFDPKEAEIELLKQIELQNKTKVVSGRLRRKDSTLALTWSTRKKSASTRTTFPGRKRREAKG